MRVWHQRRHDAAEPLQHGYVLGRRTGRSTVRHVLFPRLVHYRRDSQVRQRLESMQVCVYTASMQVCVYTASRQA
jgi:hypothetical protein